MALALPDRLRGGPGAAGRRRGRAPGGRRTGRTIGRCWPVSVLLAARCWAPAGRHGPARAGAPRTPSRRP
eukprot:3187512-Lingulodinium_polyedra.AAC.1